jgi:hypothetical protein
MALQACLLVVLAAAALVNVGAGRAAAGARSRPAKAQSQPTPVKHHAASGGAGGQAAVESPQEHRAALSAERRFAREVMQRFNLPMTPIETPHFVIWTTLPAQQQPVLSSECEGMYAALLKIFQLPADRPVFLGKCGVFVLGTQEQFKGFCQFAQEVPPDRLTQASGFCVSLPDGRSRIIAFWPGNADELAATLVHEGSHAFLHRYHGDSPVPSWFNEGLADHVTGLVLGRRCEQGREALQEAAEWVRNDPQVLSKMLAKDDKLPGQYYPVAQSVVAFLVQADGRAFVQLIQGLKNTEPFGQVLQRTYGASVGQLNVQWQKWLLQTAQSGRALY